MRYKKTVVVSTEEPTAKDQQPPKFRPWWVAALLVIWLSVGLAPKLTCDPGPFGDMFGMVNSLFSALAFLLLIHTIRLQMHEIHLQAEELKLTRQELKRSADAQSLQVLISAITAEISTALQRREMARAKESDLRSHMLKTGDEYVKLGCKKLLLSVAIQESEAVQTELTHRIDELSERLRSFGNKLTVDLERSASKSSP